MKRFSQFVQQLSILNNKPIVPLSIIHFINTECNARCKHCFIYYDEEVIKNNPRYELKNLRLDEIEKITKSFNGKLGAVYITGGEPFLRMDLDEIVEFYINNAGVTFLSITTNGFMTNVIEDKVRKICTDNPNVNFYISISLDNFAEKHDENRKLKNSFKNAINTYKKIKEHNLKNLTLNINITVVNQSTDELVFLYNYLVKTEKIDSVNCCALRGDPAEKSTINFNLEGYKTLMRLMEEGIKNGELKSFSGFKGADIFNAKNISLRKRVLDEVVNKKYMTPCHAGTTLAVMHSNGIVYPCEILDKQIGNIKEYDYNFLELWNSNKAIEVRKFIKDTNCHCSFECAWSQNILVEPMNWPLLISDYARLKLRKISLFSKN